MAEKKGKEFVWLGLRISFWTIVGLYAISTIWGYINPNIVKNTFFVILSFIWFFLLIFTFVVSIIHLTKYKEKALAIIALVISSLFFLFILFEVFAGVGGVV